MVVYLVTGIARFRTFYSGKHQHNIHMALPLESLFLSHHSQTSRR